MARKNEGAAASSPKIIWSPQPRQEAFILCPSDEVLFGGARGGGKTDAVLGDWLSHSSQHGDAANGLVIRRERTQLVEMIDRAKQIFLPLNFQYREVEKQFTAPNGARLRFAYLESDTDCEAYQGHSYTRLYFEELTTFPNETIVTKMLATLRSARGVKCQMKSTCNPSGVGHAWVKRRYAIDEYPLGMQQTTVEGRTRIFIPSKVGDNKFLDQASYVQALRSLGNEQLVRAWLEGDWNVTVGSFFTEFEPVKHVLRPIRLPRDWTKFRSMDWGSARPFCVHWWCVAGDDVHTESGMIPRGALICYREWYGASAPNVGLKMTAEQVAEGIRERSFSEEYAYSVLDPSAFACQSGPSIAERMFARGVTFRPADNQRAAKVGAMGGWNLVRHRLIGDGEHPMIYFFSTCRDIIRTLPAAVHDARKPEDVDTEGEDHALDSLRYACASRPFVRNTEPYDGPVDPLGAPSATRFVRDWKFLNEMTWGEFERECGIQLGRSRRKSSIRIN
jgi:hypothetical protein